MSGNLKSKLPFLGIFIFFLQLNLISGKNIAFFPDFFFYKLNGGNIDKYFSFLPSDDEKDKTIIVYFDFNEFWKKYFPEQSYLLEKFKISFLKILSPDLIISWDKEANRDIHYLEKLSLIIWGENFKIYDLSFKKIFFWKKVLPLQVKKLNFRDFFIKISDRLYNLRAPLVFRVYSSSFSEKDSLILKRTYTSTSFFLPNILKNKLNHFFDLLFKQPLLDFQSKNLKSLLKGVLILEHVDAVVIPLSFLNTSIFLNNMITTGDFLFLFRGEDFEIGKTKIEESEYKNLLWKNKLFSVRRSKYKKEIKLIAPYSFLKEVFPRKRILKLKTTLLQLMLESLRCQR